MADLKRTDSANADFIELVRELDTYLSVADGKEHSFYHQYNGIDNLKHVIVAYIEGKAVSCGAIKEYTADAMEVKRMYTKPECRGRGVAHLILKELETWAAELGYKRCVLETGKRQVEAVRLYNKSGYNVIPNYGQYAGVENSVCFEKGL